MSATITLHAENIATFLFAIAVLHTFSTKFFSKMAHRHPAHSGLWHLLGEVEVVFGFWAFILAFGLVCMGGTKAAEKYLESRDFTEPMFVFVIMVIAASRPILEAVQTLIRRIARVLPMTDCVAVYLLALGVVPLLGSFITEPAAMTLAALILRDGFFAHKLSSRLQYATVGVLFVNVSIGGALTPYAAPPILMVAGKWGWDTVYMLSHFGWKAATAVAVNACFVTWLFHKEIAGKGMGLSASSMSTGTAQHSIPPTVTIIHLFFLLGVVVFAHTPEAFMGLFLFFLGFTAAYKRYQSPLILREGLLVAFFLAGLITLGGLQQWWLEQALLGIDSTVLFFVATALTAITDNAALTYLGSLVPGVDNGFKYALVAGAITGGGLTVIANAPNPAGFSILKKYFPDEAISPLWLFLAALGPTCVAIVAFMALPGL